MSASIEDTPIGVPVTETSSRYARISTGLSERRVARCAVTRISCSALAKRLGPRGSPCWTPSSTEIWWGVVQSPPGRKRLWRGVVDGPHKWKRFGEDSRPDVHDDLPVHGVERIAEIEGKQTTIIRFQIQACWEDCEFAAP